MNNYIKILLSVVISFGFMTNAYAWKISAGTVTMNDPTVTSGYQTVSFTGSFFDVAPVVFILPRNSETEPRSLRIRSVTTSGFEIVQVRPTVCGGCADAGNFATPTISWIAIEPGRHRLPSGDYIEVGTVDTTTSQSKLGGTEGWDTVNFSSAFSIASIAMVGQVQTTNNAVSTTGGTNSPFITTAIRNANANNFEIAMELSEVSAAPPGSSETIGWLAAEDGMTDTLTDTGSGSVLIEAILSGDSITNSCNVDNTFSNSYSSNPLVVASKNRLDGADGGWTRQCQISTSAVRVKIQEDEGSDTDVNHTTESVGIFVVEGAFDAEVIDPTANPIANWRMDELSWSGTSGEVSDETGNFDATALNSAQTSDSTPAIAGNPGTCYYGTFPFNNTASPPVAVDSGLNIDTDVGNVGTITMWYFSNTDWNGGGDRQLLDAGFNAAAGGPKYFFLTLQNGGNLRFGYEDSADGDWRINSPAQTFVAGDWVHIAVTWDLPNDMQAIFIDGVQVATGTGNTNGVMGELNNLFIGDNNGEYITGDTTANSANGGIDEVRIYDSVLSTVDINSIRNETHSCQSDLYFEVDSVALNDTNTTPSYTSVNFRQTYPSAPLVFALPTNTDTDPASLRIRNVTTTGFEIAQVESESLDGGQNAMTVDYIAIMPGVNTLPDGTTIEAGTHTTTSVQHGSGVPGGEAWDTVNFTSTFSVPSVLLQIQGLANEYNNPPTTTSRPWLTASIRNVGNTSFQTALERSEVNDGAAATIAANETIAYLAIDGNIQGSFTAEGKTILYESINSADAIAGWDNENCATNVGESISFINTYSSTPLAIAHTRRHDGGDGGWIVRCSIDASQIGLAFEEDIFRDAERSHTNEQASVFVFSEAFCYPTCVSTTVDHYDIDFSSLTGITCLPVDVTITAKDNTGGLGATVNHTSLTTINFNTSTNLGQWGTPSSGTGLFSDPTPGTPDNGDFSYEYPIGENSVTIPLSYTEFAVAGNSEMFEIDITTSPDEDGGIADADDDPSVTFEFTKIIFNNVTDTNNTITTQISGKPSDTGFNSKTYNLQVLNADEDDPSVCQSIFGNGDVVNIDLGAECKNPDTCAGNELNIDNINPALPAAGIDITTSDDDGGVTTIASYEPGGVDLEFGVNAAAEIVLTYPDAGSLELHARYELLLDDGVTGSGEYATGISNSFVVRPFGFAIDTIEDAGAVANPASNDATGPVFVKAGEDFVATVRAYNWGIGDDDGTNCDVISDPPCLMDDGIPDTNANLSDNNGGGGDEVTPNFQGTGAIDVTLSSVAPNSPGTGTLGNLEDSVTNLAPVITAASFSSGIATVSTIYYDEVGTMTLKADGLDYLSTGQAITGRSSNIAANPNNGSVGRFTPDRFLLSDNSPTLLNTCAAGNFTYMDEVFAYDTVPQITVSAVNTYGDPTVNYGDGGTAATDYWKLPTELIRSYDDNGVNNGSNFVSAATATVTITGEGGFTDGAGTLSFNNTVGDRDTLMFDRTTIDLNAAEGGPFTASIDLLLEVENGINSSLFDTDNVCYDGDMDGTCEFDGSDDYTALTDTGGTALTLNQLRFGRLNIGTAFGSELLTLSPRLVVEYYTGTRFDVNDADTCTTLVLSDHIRLDNTGTVVTGDSMMTVGSGSTSITTFNSPLVLGDTGTVFSAPGEGNTGFVNITANLTCSDAVSVCALTTNSYPHLLYDWSDTDDMDNGPYTENPSGRIDFGIFEGPNSFIYIREPWP